MCVSAIDEDGRIGPVVIECRVSMDERGHVRLPQTIGPFPSRADARMFMDSLRPFWGEWNCSPVAGVDDVRKAVSQARSAHRPSDRVPGVSE